MTRARRTAGRLARRLPAPARKALGTLRRPAPPALTRLRRGSAPAPPPPPPPKPPPRKPRPPAPAPARAVPDATLLRALERGKTVEQALVAQTRALVRSGRHDAAQSLAESLRRQPDTQVVGHVCGGIVAFRRGFVELAWDELRRVPRPLWARLAAAEYVRSGLAVAPGDALAEVRALVADDPPEVRAKAWYDVVTATFGYGDGELAREAFARFERHLEQDRAPWKRGAFHRDWMREWVAADPDSPTAPAPEGGRRTFAVIDYGHPGANRASANIGDHVQSIAALGHLVRHRGVRLHGPPPLVDLLDRLGERTRPERRRDDIATDLEVMAVHRDASMYQAIPEGTWALCFGWYMHALFSMRHGFPLHRNLRPIFISFHCNKRGLLTPAAIDYLKRYGPVGCRDWTTVDLLLSVGVPAFFSGCLTTTIDTVFPPLADGPPAGAPLACVDIPEADVPVGAVSYRHSSDAVRRRPFVENVGIALDRLETYRREHSAVLTSRLHCYLPLRSIGAEVEFRPKNRADIRLDGLLDISDAAFDAMRDGLLGKLEQVFTAILAGRSEEEVYALWRDITAADVAAAEAHHVRPPAMPPEPPERREAARRATAARVTYERAADAAPDDVVHCAVALPRDGGRALPVLIASLLEHAEHPLHVWVLARAGAEAVDPGLADRFPTVTLSWIPAGGVAHELRLLLPELLPRVGRVVVLPLPAVATADVAELAELELGPYGLAAPRRLGTAGVSGFGVIHGAAGRLGHRTDAAAELRRIAHGRHRFDFDAFTGEVLVLDLARWRETGLGSRAVGLAAAYELDELEALHVLVGPDRATVPERWAVVPTRSPERGPGLLHWADGVKPWQPELTPERERWRRHAAALRASAPTAPRTGAPSAR